MATMVGKQKDIGDLLNALIELDLDAVEAYDAAIDRIDDLDDKARLGEFRSDHERHVRELQPLVVELGEKPAEGPDIKRVLTKGKVVLASLIGDRLILLAMKTNEDDTNVAYDRAVARDDIPAHIHEVLLRNRDDERRHRAYMEKRLADFDTVDTERAPTAQAEAPPASQGEASVR
ncbi:MAG TPA: DUF2383 domain-containing protein [Labilithrix sp.]|jgi:uncharacterized protein (TIGR02284 family)|nr:DUF2383 domain-containing protein [Labilithrix sp.]